MRQETGRDATAIFSSQTFKKSRVPRLWEGCRFLGLDPGPSRAVRALCALTARKRVSVLAG